MPIKHLNEAQREAVLSFLEQHTLVLAGAGTGKTTLLTSAVAYLAKVKKVPPNQILLLTFTNKAAEQMLARATQQIYGSSSRLVGKQAVQPMGGTFHAFGIYLLKTYREIAGVKKNFTIIDREDSLTMVKHAFESVTSKTTRDEMKTSPYQILDVISAARNYGVTVVEFLNRLDWTSELFNLRDWTAEVETIDAGYTKVKRDRGQLDFDDLLEHTITILSDKHTQAAVQRKFPWVLADESQDLNRVQLRILRLLTGPDTKVMAVGDDLQSVYRFRFAEPATMRRFHKRWDANLVKLEQNYRSSQQVLDVANAFTDRMEGVYRKQLYTKTHPGGEKPLLVSFRSAEEEAFYVVGEIKRLIGAGHPPSEIVVLYRNNRDPTAIETLLDRSRIRYAKYGGIRFKDTAHVKDVMAHVRLAVNPLDEMAMLRALQLIQGVGPATAKAVYRETHICHSFASAIQGARLKDTIRWRLNELVSLMTGLHKKSRDPEQALTDVVTYYKKCPLPYNQQRLRDLDHLLNLAGFYKSLKDMVRDFAIDKHKDKEQDEGKIILSTVHSFKGLEAQTVYLVQVNERQFPTYRSRSEEDVEEEKRLFYVALTRAKTNLTVTSVVTHMTGASPFISLVPSKLVRQGKVTWQAAGPATPPTEEALDLWDK